MKRRGAFAAAILLVSPLAVLAQDEGYYDRSFARVSYVKGDVFVQRSSDQGYEQGEVNLPVVQGDKLGTRDGRAEIHFGKRNYLRLDANTQLDFKSLPQRDGDVTKLHLLSGRIYLRIAFQEREKSFEVHTPDASFYVLDEGLYRFEIGEGRETELFVLDGSVEAAGEEGSVLVREDDRLTASNGVLRSHGNDDAGTRDDFAEWNADRDGLLRPRATTRYVPDEIDEYQDELDSCGRWVYERPYGYVWIPDIYDYDWRPYSYGRWVWYPIIGWTWVPYESWGWCVYHYGRWHWRLGLGWYWIPHRHWGPAWVHWWWDYDYCGWCPLNWYNRPVIIINNYFYTHYDYHDYPWNSRALTVVRRSQLQARHVSREALSPERIRSLGKISLRAQQPDIKPVIDRTSPEHRLGERIFKRDDIREVRRDFALGKGLPNKPRFRVEELKRDPAGTFDKSPIRERAGDPLKREIRAPERSLVPGQLKTYPSRRTDEPSFGLSRSLTPRSPEHERRGSLGEVSVPRPEREIKTYAPRFRSSSSPRSGSFERRDEPSSSSRTISPRESESRESRSSSGAFGDFLRSFRSRFSDSGDGSDDRDSAGDSRRRSTSISGDRDDEFRSRDSSSSSRSTPSYRSSSRSGSSPSRSSGSSSRSGSSSQSAPSSRVRKK